MNLNLIMDMINRIRTTTGNPNVIRVLGGVSSAIVSSYEKQLNVTFCQDYVDYLINFGQIESSLFMLFGINIYKGSVIAPVLDQTDHFFQDVLERELGNTTVLANEGEDEWFLLLDHTKAVVTPYDPFSGEFVSSQSLTLEECILAELLSHIT